MMQVQVVVGDVGVGPSHRGAQRLLRRRRHPLIEAPDQARLGPAPPRPLRPGGEAFLQAAAREVEERHEGDLGAEEILVHVRRGIIGAEQAIHRTDRTGLDIHVVLELPAHGDEMPVDHLHRPLEGSEGFVQRRRISLELLDDEVDEGVRVTVFGPPQPRRLLHAALDALLLCRAVQLHQARHGTLRRLGAGESGGPGRRRRKEPSHDEKPGNGAQRTHGTSLERTGNAGQCRPSRHSAHSGDAAFPRRGSSGNDADNDCLGVPALSTMDAGRHGSRRGAAALLSPVGSTRFLTGQTDWSRLRAHKGLRSPMSNSIGSSFAARKLLFVVLLLALPWSAQGGSIVGTIRDAQSGLPLGRMDLDVFNIQLEQVLGVDAPGMPDNDNSAADGTFLLDPLPAGRYYVRVDPTLTSGYPVQYYPEVFLQSQALPVQLRNNGIVNVDFYIARGHRCRGRVVDVITGEPLAGVD